MITAQHLVYGFNNNLDSNPFSIRVKTDNAGTSASNQFTIPLQVISGLTYDFFVDWGDGEFTSHNTTANVTHTFPSAGVYDIKIYGKFEKIYFANTGDKLKLLEVLQWGDYYGRFSNQGNAFWGCSNLTSIANDCDVLNEFVTIGDNMFRQNQLTSLPSGMTLNNLTIGDNMFRQNQLTLLPSGMTFNNLTSGVLMFYMNQLTNLPSGMALSSLTNGNQMFYMNQLTETPYLNMTNVTNLTGFARNNPNWIGPITIGTQILISINSLAWFNKFNQDMSAWNFHPNCDFSNTSFSPSFSNLTSFSNENYGKLLVRIENQCGAGKGRTAAKVLGVANTTKYPAFAASARAALVADGWDIRDGGAE